MRDDIFELYENDNESKIEDNLVIEKKIKGKKKKCKKYLRKSNKLLKKQNKRLKKMLVLFKSNDRKQNVNNVSERPFLTKLCDAFVKAVPAVLTTIATTVLTFIFKKKTVKGVSQSHYAIV